MPDKIKTAIKAIIGSLIGVLALTLFFTSWVVVNPGEVGVLIRLGTVIDTLNPGFHLKAPFIDAVDITNVQTQKEQVDTLAASSDLQDVKATIAVNYNVDPNHVSELYTKVGDGFGDTIIAPAIQETVKAVTANYTAEELITKRPQVTDDIQTALSQKLVTNEIVVTSVSIVNFEFSDSFNAAIDAKVTAEQNALAAKNKLDQVKYEADQRVAEADGEAKAIAIQAQAIQAQGGADYVKLQAIGKWDGHLPTYMTGNTPVPFVNVAQ